MQNIIGELLPGEIYDEIQQLEQDALQLMLKKKLDWKSTKVTVCVLGESQCGKTTLINNILGLEERKGSNNFKYVKDTLENVIFWEIPKQGFSFPNDKFLESVINKQCDALLVLCKSELNSNYNCYIKTFQEKDIPFTFVHTSINDSKPEIEIREEVFFKLNKKCDDLKLISVNLTKPYSANFCRLIDDVCNDLSDEKKQTLALTVRPVTNSKEQVLRERIPLVALSACLKSVIHVDNVGNMGDLIILQSEVDMYLEQMCLDDRCLANMVCKNNMHINDLQNQISHVKMLLKGDSLLTFISYMWIRITIKDKDKKIKQICNIMTGFSTSQAEALINTNALLDELLTMMNEDYKKVVSKFKSFPPVEAACKPTDHTSADLLLSNMIQIYQGTCM